jgi:hypothetical protein
MNLRTKILEAVQRHLISIRFVTIHPLDPEAWGCKDEAYCVHILTHKRDNPNYDPVAGRWDRCIEDKKDAATADALAADIEALGKIDDRELHSDNTFYTRQVYVGVE